MGAENIDVFAGEPSFLEWLIKPKPQHMVSSFVKFSAKEKRGLRGPSVLEMVGFGSQEGEEGKKACAALGKALAENTSIRKLDLKGE